MAAVSSPVTPGRAGAASAAWPHRIAILALGALHVTILAPVVSRSYPSDDTLLLVPLLRADLADRPFSAALAYLLSPAEPDLPQLWWRLYVLLTQALLGPTNGRLVMVGLVLHAVSSVLVAALGRRIGLSARGAWLAGGLHLTAYPGFHAYLWPVAVQHVLSVLGILAVVTLYLASEQRRREGRPYRAWWWATTVTAVLASFSRGSGSLGPLVVLAHVVLAGGDPRERRRRYDVWALPVLLSLIYPIALLAYEGDLQPILGLPGALTVLRWLRELGSARNAFVVLVAVAVAILFVVRVGVSLAARGQAPQWLAERLALRYAVWALVGVLVAPVVARMAVVFAGGVEQMTTPLALALNSRNTVRWHQATLPIDLVAVVLAAGLLALFFWGYRPHGDMLVLLVLFAGFCVRLPITTGHIPGRYWIYATPVLAIVFAGALDGAATRLAEAAPWARRRWMILVPIVAVTIVALTNLAAIRLEAWRHKLADSYQALEYVRAADLIRRDLDHARAAPGVLVCVDGLDPLPYHEAWVEGFQALARLREYNARVILAQALGRRDLSSVRIDCGRSRATAYAYRVVGAEVQRNGQSVDPFQRLHEELRARIAAGDLPGARAVLDQGSGGQGAWPRPFLIRYLLDGLPDDDVDWITNGLSLLVWLDQIADSYDRWYWRAEPKVEALRVMATADVKDYLRFLFLVHHVRTSRGPKSPGSFLRHPIFPFGGIAARELETVLHADDLFSSSEALRRTRAALLNTPPYWYVKRPSVPRRTPDWAFFSLLGRILARDLGIRPQREIP